MPQSWILECARMVGVAQNIITLIENSMENSKSVDIKPGGTWDSTHQKSNPSRRLTIAIPVCDYHYISVTDSKRDTRAGYQLKGEGCKINHLLFKDDLKIYGKTSSV